MEDQPITTSTQRSAHRQIAEKIRAEILQGKRAPGTRLPSTSQLATDWKASYFTVYTALQSLVKEGLVERMRGRGSYVADPKNRFTCAGIYHSSDIFVGEQTAYSRRLHVSLVQSLARIQIDSQVFVDSRPETRQGTLLPSLAEAILNRRIQCIIAPAIPRIAQRAWARLALPTVFGGNFTVPNHADFEMEGFLRESVRRLAAQGCRSVGVMSNVVENPQGTNITKVFHDFFRKAVRAEGLATREEWIRKPLRHTPDMEALGYQEFKKLWRLREKPEGLIIYPDFVVRGAILAILEIGIATVPPQMKFVFHRNAHIPFICPFSVTWGISDEDALAEELIRSIMRQFRGEKNSPVLVPFSFVRDKL